MTGEIRAALAVLTDPGQVVELRILGDRVSSGYFDNPDELARIAPSWDTPESHGVYITLNPVSPALLSRRANRVKRYLNRSDPTTADHDITMRNWLPVDIDPVRPSGISSSDAEHQAALDRAAGVARFLADLGFPDPVIADSGNGAHLLYRVDLPNDAASRDLIAGCLHALDTRFSDDRCRVDTANANAGRIWKLYGTMARKGDSTQERPHRPSSLLSVPDPVTVVSRDLLSRLAHIYPPSPADSGRPPRSGGKGTSLFDLGEWLDQNLPGYRSKPYLGGTIYLLDTCPFSTAHSDGAYAIQFSNGAVFAGCHHDSCGGGIQRWKELKDRFGPKSPGGKGREPSGALVRPPAQAPSRAAAQNPQEARPKNPPSPYQTGDIPSSLPVPHVVEEAGRIFRTADPLSYMLDTFSLDHEGDRTVAECLIMSLASRSVTNSRGLHVSITGESGKGKSHTFETILRQVPPQYQLDGRMSEKALFYITGMEPGTVITLDDHALSDQMQEILKGVTTSFHRPFLYHTVSKDRTGQVCTIPERCVWWIAKVEGTGDDQVCNRMLTCWIDDSEDQDLRVLERTLEHAEQGPGSGIRQRVEHTVCQEIWNLIDPAFVIIPFASRIRFHSALNRRNPDMLLDLIRSHAILRQARREETMEDAVRCIIATEEDFTGAARLYASLNGECGGQMTKLTRRESELLDSIRTLGQTEFSVREMQQISGFSYSSISKLLNGYVSKGQNYSGLLEKCPALSFLDRTVSSGADGQTTQRRMRVYTWDEILYAAWKGGGGVWLAPGSGDDPSPDDPSDGNHPGDDPGCGMAGKRREDQAFADCCRNQNSEENESEREMGSNNMNNNIVAANNAPEASPPHTPGLSPGVPDLRHSAREMEPEKTVSPIALDHTETASDAAATNRESAASDSEPLHPRPLFHRPLTLSSIDPGDYIAVEGWPRKKPCVICGKPYTHYQERMTRERMAAPPRENRMLCSGCYEMATVKRALSVRTIPGVIDITALSHRSSPTGRCTVCNTGPGIWADSSQRVSLCETCYQREKVSDRPVSVIAGGKQ